MPGDAFIDIYLAIRRDIDAKLPADADRTLSFAEFAIFAAAAAQTRRDIHLQPQNDMLNIPGLPLDFIGKVETFDADFARVLDHLDASEALRREAAIPLINPTTTIGRPITRAISPTVSTAPTSAILTVSAIRAHSQAPRSASRPSASP